MAQSRMTGTFLRWMEAQPSTLLHGSAERHPGLDSEEDHAPAEHGRCRSGLRRRAGAAGDGAAERSHMGRSCLHP
jgi:hypothetical protein